MLKIAKQFAKDIISVEFLTECRNSIYKVNCKKYSFVIRLINQKRKSKEQIESELHFQNYLFDNGADVVRPLPSYLGDYCIDSQIDDQRYWVSAFEYAEGKDWSERDDNNEKTFQLIGKALGKIHRLSKEYDAKDRVKRRLWSEQQELINAPILYKNYNPALYEAFVRHMEVMDNLEKNVHTFGLTHGDYLMSNYLIDDDNIKVIDFDECEYSWYAMDLAICMRCYLIGDAPEKVSNKVSVAEMMHYHLLSGYSTENTVNEQMVYAINSLIKVRDFIELSQLLELLDQGKTLGHTENKLLQTDLDRVINDNLFLNFNKQRVEKLL